MIVTLGGVRGSAPLSDPPGSRYGTDTTSVQVDGAGGERVQLDLGSGARNATGARPGVALLLLFTHYHHDHLCGLPFLPGLESPKRRMVFAAPRMNHRTVRSVLSRWMAPPFWPLRLDDFPAQIEYRTLRPADAARGIQWGGLCIRWTRVHHSEDCYAYRVEEARTRSAFVLATDLEWAASSMKERLDFFRLVQEPEPADLLLFDAQYTPGEYIRKHGWGHSRWSDAVEVARKTGVARMGLVHHDPGRTDEDLDRIDRKVRAACPTAHLARQGEVFHLPARGRGCGSAQRIERSGSG